MLDTISEPELGDGMEIRYVDDQDGLAIVVEALDSADRVAVDCEAAGYHRYSDRLCLIQLTQGDRTFLLDPFGVDPEPIVRPVLEDPRVEVVMHGADYDVRLLDRDLGVRPAGLFDTQIAASLLGVDGVGLSSLLEDRLGIRISKKYQRADWAKRPLPEPMREYAALDTAHLSALADLLREELVRLERLEWAQEEFEELEKVRFEHTPPQDPVTRVKAARDLGVRETDRLREALRWRDRVGRETDRALFRVAGDAVLVEAARRNPGTTSELASLKGMNGKLARRWGDDLLERFREVDSRAEDQLQGYPAAPRGPNGSGGRPPPEVEDRIARLKAVRNDRAAALGMDRGTLLPNAMLQRIAESPPSRPEEIAEFTGVRRWQAGLLAEDLMAVL